MIHIYRMLLIVIPFIALLQCQQMGVPAAESPVATYPNSSSPAKLLEHTDNNKKIEQKNNDFFCQRIFPAAEILLLIGFFASMAWAISIYIRNSKPKWTEQKYLQYNELAKWHNIQSQLWFTISITIFLGGVLYAVFHVAEHSCGWLSAHSLVIGKTNIPVERPHETWAETIRVILPNMFIYSIFFIAWNWSTRNYRAHWHNFVVNEYRYSMLCAFEYLSATYPADDEFSKRLRLLYALFPPQPTETAYLEQEGEKTGIHNLLKIEEILRQMLTLREGKARAEKSDDSKSTPREGG